MTSSVPYFNEDEMGHNPFEDTVPIWEPSNVATENHETTNNSTTTSSIDVKENNNNRDDINESLEEPISSNIIKTGDNKETEGNSDQESEDIRRNKYLPEFKFQSKHYFHVKVIGLERVGSNSNKRENPTIIFKYDTDIPLFRRKKSNKIKKTIQEFKEFYKYLNSFVFECFVPTLPLPYTHFGISNQEDYETVLYQYQKWFDRVIKDPLIISNEEFVYFIESDFNTYCPINHHNSNRNDLNPNQNSSFIRYNGIKRKTMKQFQPPYDNNLILAEFRPLVKTLYHLCQSIQDYMLLIDKNFGILIQQESTLGKEFIDLDSLIGSFNLPENMTKNFLPYEKYGKNLITVSDINSVLSTMNLATLYDGLTWVVNDSYGVKESLTDRHFVMRDLISLQKQSKIKQERARKYRNKRDVNPIKLDEAIRDLQSVVKLEQRTTLKLHRITTNMEISRKEWLKWYEEWIKHNIKNYVLKNIEYERKKLNVMEGARLKIRGTNVKGGLSRLGRDHLVLSNQNIQLSQQKDIDTWTTTTRHIKNMKEILESSKLEQENISNSDNDNDSTNTTYNTLCDPKAAVRLLGRANFS
ncbi:retromer subunit VPS17 PWA37_005375 [Arxiozyma heterogenica]|uniref:retromer subunit VPS17 n=1 Tax=Arxiozyma heterogenica TaxID=278026 RepID=UPI002F183006